MGGWVQVSLKCLIKPILYLRNLPVQMSESARILTGSEQVSEQETLPIHSSTHPAPNTQASSAF